MKKYIQTINKALTSRVARNVYFWLILILVKYSDADDQSAYPKWFYYAWMGILMLFFVVLTYVNNLWLVPKLLYKKQRLLYVVTVFLLVFSVSYTYTVMMKWLPLKYPGFSAMDVSIVMSPVDSDLSFNAVINDIQTYFSTMAIWVLIFTMFWFYNNSGKRIRNMEEQLNRHRETELAFLKNQINPHFLFNTLNNLYGLALKKSDEAPETILKLSNILRYILYESNVETVSTETEKEIMQAYIDIELLRLPVTDQVQFSLVTDKPYKIAPLLWLPLIENAFKHSRSTKQTEINFRFSIKNGILTMYSKNNIGINTAENRQGGIGLANLKKRLELLYPARHTIEVNNTGNYFIIEVNSTLN